MTPELLFTICNNSVLPVWLLLFVAPGWKGTQLIVHSCAIPLLLCVVYGALAATNFFGGEGDFFSLGGVTAIFQNPYALVAGWVHYLVFDLFIGAWEARDAKRLGISHIAMVPCLFFTLMLGPVGLLLYFILRWTLRGKFIVDESQAAGEPA